MFLQVNVCKLRNADTQHRLFSNAPPPQPLELSARLSRIPRYLRILPRKVDSLDPKAMDRTYHHLLLIQARYLFVSPQSARRSHRATS